MIAAIDGKLTEQINVIMHHEDFQKLEGAWRGLHYLVNNTETDEMLKIRVMNISKKDLGKTLKKFRGTAWDQSPLFKKIYEEEYGQFGGEPFGCWSATTISITARRMCSCSATSRRSPRRRTRRSSPRPRRPCMQMDSWQRTGQSARPDQDLPDPGIRRLAVAAGKRGFALHRPDACRASWRACPTARRPSRSRSSPSRKTPKAPTAASIPGATRPMRWRPTSPGRSSCTAGASRIRGIETGGAVEGLPAHTFPTDDGGVDMKCPTEIAISDRREAELAKNGFMPLIHKKNSDFAAFIGAQSLQKPQEYDDPAATANANLAARLPYLFATCRFAHYLKCMVRDKIGSTMSKAQLQDWLQPWLINYVDGSPDRSSVEYKATHPLADGAVEVEENEENPGYYSAKFYLKPHYQLEGLTVSLRLVSRMPEVTEGVPLATLNPDTKETTMAIDSYMYFKDYDKDVPAI